MTKLQAAVCEWRDARRVFFTAATSPPISAWTRLADAEHKLMQLAESISEHESMIDKGVDK